VSMMRAEAAASGSASTIVTSVGFQICCYTLTFPTIWANYKVPPGISSSSGGCGYGVPFSSQLLWEGKSCFESF
jgi:hypothetical protein